MIMEKAINRNLMLVVTTSRNMAIGVSMKRDM